MNNVRFDLSERQITYKWIIVFHYTTHSHVNISNHAILLILNIKAIHWGHHLCINTTVIGQL